MALDERSGHSVLLQMNSGAPHSDGPPPSAGRPEVSLAPGALDRDRRLAATFGLKLATTREISSWQFVRSAGTLELCAPDHEGGYRVTNDVSQGAMARRLRTARRTDPLPRAVGLHRPGTPPDVVDATAGLGRDALVLATLGCDVIALERIPALAFLLRCAADDCGDLPLQVVCADAQAWLAAPPRRPTVVYLDPMFEEQGKAQVKKEMQACRALAGGGDDPAALLAAARAVAAERVVVKRHPQLPPLADGVAHSVHGERVRFDVYLAGS